MSGDRYFILGGGVLQQDFVDTVKQMGFETHVFDYNPDCPCAKEADVFHCISIDAKDEILAMAERLSPVAIQSVATEIGNVTACYIGEKLGLFTNNYQTALDTTDKSRMKNILCQNGIPSAEYIEAHDIDEVPLNDLVYPVVVKAADRSAGRGVRRVHNDDEFQAAFADAIQESHNKKVIVEECIHGLQYSVETISSNGQHQVVAVTEETFDGTDYLIETRHMLPANISSVHYEMISGLALQTLTLLNVRYGAGHIEMKMTTDGLKIIEVASRAGGCRDLMVLKALGCNYNRLIVDASLGRNVNVVFSRHKYVVSVFLLRESDYTLFKKMKAMSPHRIIREKINAFDASRVPKTLMDSQGIFYLLFDNQEDAESIIERII